QFPVSSVLSFHKGVSGERIADQLCPVTAFRSRYRRTSNSSLPTHLERSPSRLPLAPQMKVDNRSNDITPVLYSRCLWGSCTQSGRRSHKSQPHFGLGASADESHFSSRAGKGLSPTYRAAQSSS